MVEVDERNVHTLWMAAHVRHTAERTRRVMAAGGYRRQRSGRRVMMQPDMGLRSTPAELRSHARFLREESVALRERTHVLVATVEWHARRLRRTSDYAQTRYLDWREPGDLSDVLV